MIIMRLGLLCLTLKIVLFLDSARIAGLEIGIGIAALSAISFALILLLYLDDLRFSWLWYQF